MKIQPNQPCPCGSGRKHKKCCGAPRAAGPLLANKIEHAWHAVRHGAFAEGLALAAQILQTKPDSVEGHYIAGLACLGMGDASRARHSLEQAAAVAPDRSDVACRLASVLFALGDHSGAAGHARRALAISPANGEAHNLLGLALQSMGELERAATHLRSAVVHVPGNAIYQANLGAVEYLLNRFTPAEEHFLAALRLAPSLPTVHTSLSSVYLSTNRLEQAHECLMRALALNPADQKALTNLDRLCFEVNYEAGLTPQQIFEVHRIWGQSVEADVRPMTPVGRAPSGRRLRIGYVSPDFREHPVAYFIEPVLANHDRERVEVYCYADAPKPDAVTRRLQSHVRNWRDTTGLSDDQLAEMIRGDGIDILVDLAGHTIGNRLRVFARRPTPLQVSYLGYPNTTGLSRMDYYFTDCWADPEGLLGTLFTERLLRLPEGMSCFRPAECAPEVGGLPASRKGFVTFASLNNARKMSDPCVSLWCKILRAVPASRLILQSSMRDDHVSGGLLEKFAAEGIAPDRIEWRGATNLQDHLATYSRVDIALDPFPWNGHTTTCHALWMGVPVVTLAGNTHVSRLATSVLTQASHDDFVAASEEDYVSLAIGLATDIENLALLRARLREQVAASSLRREKAFTQALEDAYERVWKTSAAGGIPGSMEV